MSNDKFSNLFWNNLKTSDITNDPNQPQQGFGGTPEQPAIPGSQTPGALPANPLEGGGIDPITGQPASGQTPAPGQPAIPGPASTPAASGAPIMGTPAVQPSAQPPATSAPTSTSTGVRAYPSGTVEPLDKRNEQGQIVKNNPKEIGAPAPIKQTPDGKLVDTKTGEEVSPDQVRLDQNTGLYSWETPNYSPEAEETALREQSLKQIEEQNPAETPMPETELTEGEQGLYKGEPRLPENEPEVRQTPAVKKLEELDQEKQKPQNFEEILEVLTEINKKAEEGEGKPLDEYSSEELAELAKELGVSEDEMKQIQTGLGKGLNRFQKGYIGLKTLKNIMNNPNKKLQTQGIPGQAQGPAQFGVINSKTATYGDDYQSPSSITRRIEDPENIDPQQRPDGSNDHWDLDMKDVNSDGQSRSPRGSDDFQEQYKRKIVGKEDDKEKSNEDLYSPALERLLSMLPLVEHYFNSDDAGIDDPMLKDLHDNLESEFPNYLENGIPDENARILLILNREPEENKKESSKDGFVGPESAEAPTTSGGDHCTNPNHQSDTLSPGQPCPQCLEENTPAANQQGMLPSTSVNKTLPGTYNPETMVGPSPQQLKQMQMQQQQMQQRAASNTQGPHTDAQQAAVAEILINDGREDEVERMLSHEYRHEYAIELADAQNKGLLSDEDPQTQPQPPAPVAPPMPNEGMPPGIPPMGAPTPADLGAPGPAAGAAPGVMASMLKAAFKHGADNVAGKCPKCDSHTTKMVQQDGVSKCHTCGHQWKDKTFEKADGDSSNSSTTAAFLVDHADEERHPYNIQKDLTSERMGIRPREDEAFLIKGDEENPTWSTDWINELEEKYPQIANMSDAKRHEFLEKRGLGDVPTGDLLEKKYVPEDIGKAASLDSFVEPEEEELEIDDSTHEWLDENGEPLKEGKEYEIYAHDYDIPDVGRVVEIKPDAIVYEIESDGGLRTTIEIDRNEADLNGYRFVESGIGSSAENHPGIEENMDSKPVPVPGESTDLSTPHVMTGSTKFSFEDYDEALVTEAIEWLLSLDGPYVFREFEGLSQEEYEDEILNTHPDVILRAVDQNYDGGLDQLARDTGIANPDDNPEEGLSAFGKTAGRHYTPMEQRELIDEYGEARNADKLDLENTHYAQADDDYFLFGC